MFGHQNDIITKADDQTPVVAADPAMSTPPDSGTADGDMGVPAMPADLSQPTAAPDVSSDIGLGNAASLASEPSAAPDLSAAAAAFDADQDLSAPTMPSPATPPDDLLNLKQQALQQLSPLVGHLDQTPEEKFRTTMMMIQANDDQSLIKNAYDSAQQITDEKARAQALLDIVNEINYFTQKKP